MLVSTLISFQLIVLAFHADYDMKTVAPSPETSHFSQPINPCKTKIANDADISFQKLDSLKKKMKEADCKKPELLLEVVDTVISRNATRHFAFAQELYFQFLQADEANENFHFLAAEAEKIIPLLSDKDQDVWRTKIKNRDPGLSGLMLYFWRTRDPVLSTPVNERLSEHWERIAYAQKNFKKNDHGIYGTDDRGTVYVRYGPPTLKRSGLLSPSNTEIRSKLYDLASFKGGIDPRELFNLNMSIKQQYMPKYYEVWVYRNLGSKQPLLFIFGESANRGTFGLRKSLEDFIPNGSFSMGISSSWRYDTGPRGLTAGPFLQMALYDRLSTIDIYFGRQLASYEENWMKYMQGQLNFSAFKMINNSPKAEIELKKIQDRAPETKSSLEERLNLISQQYKSYRFLDDQNKPYRKVIVFSEPHNNLIPYDAVISRHQKPVYKLTVSVELIDRKGRTTYGDKQEVYLRGDRSGAIGTLLDVSEPNLKMEPDSSVILVSSEVARIPQLKNEEIEGDKFILASAVNRVNGREPLNTKSGRMVVSDIIWGYRGDEQTNYIDELSFSVPKDDLLPKDKNLTVYFETYHLKTGADSQYHYQVDYSIQQKRRRKLKDTGIKLTLNLSSASPRGSENIEIKTADLDPGTYRAVFRFSTTSAPDIIKERHINFRIEE